MKKKDQTPKTREQIFAEKADNYGWTEDPQFGGYVEEFLW